MNEFTITICGHNFRYKLGVGFYEYFRHKYGVTFDDMAKQGNGLVLFTFVYEAVNYFNSSHNLDCEFSRSEFFDMMETEYVINPDYMTGLISNITEGLSRITYKPNKK